MDKKVFGKKTKLFGSQSYLIIDLTASEKRSRSWKCLIIFFYHHLGFLVLENCPSKSLIKTTKTSEPTTDPCGMPLNISTQSETILLNNTLSSVSSFKLLRYNKWLMLRVISYSKLISNCIFARYTQEIFKLNFAVDYLSFENEVLQ